MIKHIVLFKFKAFDSEVEKQTQLSGIKDSLENLIHIIPELKRIQVEININPSEKWDIILEVEVENMQDLGTYANHPDHQYIVKTMISPIKEDRACVDYIFE